MPIVHLSRLSRPKPAIGGRGSFCSDRRTYGLRRSVASLVRARRRCALRRRGGAERRVVRCRAPADLRPDRAERLGQDHAVQLHQRHLSRERRATSRSTAAGCAGLARHRMAGLGIGRTFQNLALFRTHERARQRAGRRAPPRSFRLHRQCAAPAGGAARGTAGRRRGSRRCWICSTWAKSPQSRPAACRSPRRSGSSWRAR